MLLTRQLIFHRQLLQTESVRSTNRYLSLLGSSSLPSSSVLTDKGSPYVDDEIAAMIGSTSAASRQLRWMSRKWDFSRRNSQNKSEQKTSGFRHTDEEEDEGTTWSWKRSWSYSDSDESKKSSAGRKGKSKNGGGKPKQESKQRSLSAYEILEVQEFADDGEIRASYHRMARLYHPDLHPNDPKATIRFQEITTAYEQIKNKGAREQYRFQRQVDSWTAEEGDATVIMDEGDQSDEEDEAAKNAPARPISDVVDAAKVYGKAIRDDVMDAGLFFRWRQWQSFFMATSRVILPSLKYMFPVLFFFKFPLLFKIWLGWMSIRFILIALLSVLTSPARVWNRLVARFVRKADRRRRKL